MNLRHPAWAPFLCAALIAAPLVIAVPVGAVEASCGHDFTSSEAPDDSRCTFSCKQKQLLSISIVASDTDATVSGSARCGNGFTPCRPDEGPYSCSGKEGAASVDDTSGNCTANVDEFWNSAWSYHCASEDPPAPPVEPPCTTDCEQDPRQCFVGTIVCCPSSICSSVAACFGLGMATPTFEPDPPVDILLPPDLKEALCSIVGPSTTAAAADPVSGLPAGVTSRVDVWVVGTSATGRLCNVGMGCWSILPVCRFDFLGGKMECSVPSNPKILGPVAPYNG